VISEHPAVVARLSRLSVEKHHDAYADIAWSAPEHAIDPRDPRWELGEDDPIGASGWYRALPPARRARLGLHVVASAMRTGVEFERVLKLGLLELAAVLPEDSPDQRYVYHEVVEEAQHALMFTEFLRRARAAAPDLVTPGLPALLGPVRDRIPPLARRFPELFFVFVLGGEDPIDHVQRRILSTDREVHPLLRRVMQVHVIEEARHLAFARSFLADRVPRLSPSGRRALAVAAPVILAIMARLMLRPPRHLVREYGIPRALRGDHPLQRARLLEAVRRVHDVLDDLHLAPRPLWRALGVTA
jgi:hypothetical protein